MHLTPFVHLFPEQGEMRSLTTFNHSGLPDDEYGLIEAYCTDPQCDCRRVMLNVVGRRQESTGYLASISFGFDREDELAGPFLDPLNPQSRFAEALLELVIAHALSDPSYVARLERHYRQVKRAVADPPHPVHQKLNAASRLARLNRAARRQAKRKKGR